MGNPKFLLEKKNGDANHICPFCGKCLKSEYTLHKHKFTHVPKKQYSCDICYKTFSSENALLKHQEHQLPHTHTPQKMQVQHTGLSMNPENTCKDCNKSFVLIRNLQKHRRAIHETHVAEKTQTLLSCELCNKTCRSKANLREHYFTHTGEKPHSCELCGMGFTTMNRVRRHLVTHGNDTPYTCKWCAKSFRQKSYLSTHAKHWCSVKRKNDGMPAVDSEMKLEA